MALLRKFLPSSLIDILREKDSQQVLKMFDQDSETPVLIWDATMRRELKQAISASLKGRMCQKPAFKILLCREDFVLSDGYKCSYQKIENEICISGIYVRLLLREPSFQIREPVTFFEELLLNWSNEIDEQVSRAGYKEEMTGVTNQNLECLTNAIIYICQSQKHLSALMAEWGYMEKALSYLRNAMGGANKDVAMTSIIKVIHQASHHMANIEALALLGNNDGKNGIVHCMILAIGNQQLHNEASLILGALEQIFKIALGDVDAILKSNSEVELFGIGNSHAYTNMLISVAPSPAPGIEPVKKQKTTAQDHPLAMMFDSDPQPQPITAKRGVVNTHHKYRNERMPTQPHIQVYRRSSNGHAPVTAVRSSIQSSTQKKQVRKKPFGSEVEQKAVSSAIAKRTSAYPQVQKTQRLGNPEQLQNRDEKSNNLVANSSHNITTQHTESRQNASKRLMTSTSVQSSPLSVTNRTNDPLSIFPLGPAQLESPDNNQRPSNIKTDFHAPSNLSTFHQGRQEQSPNSYSMSASDKIAFQDNINEFRGSSDELLENAKVVSSQANQFIISGLVDPLRNSSRYGLQGVEGNGDINPETQHMSLQIKDKTIFPSSFDVPTNSSFDQKEDSTQLSTSVMKDDQQYSNSIDVRVTEKAVSLSEEQLLFSRGAPGSANGRTALLFAALQCDLVPFLVNNVLVNPLLSSVKDPASAEIHLVGLLNLLLRDPGFGLKFKNILNELPHWKKYTSRESSLFQNSSKHGVPNE